MTKEERRIIEISYKYQLAHLSSCLTTVGVIDKIYKTKKPSEPFILSNGHAGLALYVILEKYGFGDAEELWKKHGTHPNRDLKDGIFASTGSLGHGIGIAVGMALADRTRNVYVTISDGECAEGSLWEALKIARDFRIENLRIALIANGYCATEKVDIEDLDVRINAFYPTLMVKAMLFSLPDFMQGTEGHYVKLDEEKYKEITK